MPRLLLRIVGVALILPAGVFLALHYGIFGLLLWAVIVLGAMLWSRFWHGPL